MRLRGPSLQLVLLLEAREADGGGVCRTMARLPGFYKQRDAKFCGSL